MRITYASMLKIDSLSKVFNDKRSHILQNFNLEIKDGEFVAILGSNGSGKSTLLNILSGLELADQGSITFDNRKIGKFEVGYIFQNYESSLLPWKTLFENIALPLKFRGFSESEQHQKIKQLVTKYKIKLNLEKYPYEVSGGQQQLTSILQNIIFDPKILLMDESFSSLDASVSLEVQNVLQELWTERKNIVIFVSHNIDEALYLANRILILKPNPLTVVHDIKNDLAYPRQNKTLASEVYSEKRRHVQKCFLQVLSDNK